MERISIFGNRGPLRRNYDPNYDPEDYANLLGGEPPEEIFPDQSPETNVFRRGGSLRRVYCATDFEIMFGHTHEQRFHSNGVNGTGANADLLTGEGIL